MTMAPLQAHAVDVLTRGHLLYGDQRETDGPTPTLHPPGRQPDRLTGWSTRPGLGGGASAVTRAIRVLRRATDVDSQMAAALADARAEHAQASSTSRSLLADARRDSMPAADTPLGQREALRRMTARIQQQRRILLRSRRRSRLLAHHSARLAYPLRHGAAVGWPPGVHPLGAVRSDGSFVSDELRKRIGAALDHLGITDPVARGNWLRGYETLIARESNGRPAAQGGGSAQGITQVVPATFARYHQPGTSGNIFDPVANICASMNYVMHRYGVSADGANLAALVQQADARRPPKGY
jgi:SLT domain-containing protein